MAAEIKDVLGLDAKLEVGRPGEFTVWVDGEKVAEKGWFSFPGPRDVVRLVRLAQAAAAERDAGKVPTRS